MLSVFLATLALCFSVASAIPNGTHVTPSRRQSIPNLPNLSQCASACSSLSASNSCLQTNTANPTVCTCSSSFGSALSSCYSCAVSAGALDSASAQQILQSLTTSCSDAGTPFSSPPTLSGGSGSSSPGGSSSPSRTSSSGGTGLPSGTSSPSAASSPSGSGSLSGNSLGGISGKNGAIITRMPYGSMAIALSGVIGLLLTA